MPANWYLPSSATATLTVGVARAEIVEFRVPPGAEVGDLIGPTIEPVAISVRNVGTLAGNILLRVRDLGGATIWTGSITLAVGGFGWIYPALNYPMPNRDLTLRAEAYHDTIVDSYIDKTIVLIVEVTTKTTLTLEPASVEPSGAYHYKGKLTRIDTSAGLAAMSIITRRYEAGVWKDIGSGTTDANGNYDIIATAPITTGEFNCQAAFPGVIPFAASSAQTSLGVGVAVLEPVWALASTALGIALIMLGYSR